MPPRPRPDSVPRGSAAAAAPAVAPAAGDTLPSDESYQGAARNDAVARNIRKLFVIIC